MSGSVLPHVYYDSSFVGQSRRELFNLPRDTAESRRVHFQSTLGNIPSYINKDVSGVYTPAGGTTKVMDQKWLYDLQGEAQLTGYIANPITNVNDLGGIHPPYASQNIWGGTAGAVRNLVSRAGPVSAFGADLGTTLPDRGPRVSGDPNNIGGEYSTNSRNATGLWRFNDLSPNDPLSWQFAAKLQHPRMNQLATSKAVADATQAGYKIMMDKMPHELRFAPNSTKKERDGPNEKATVHVTPSSNGKFAHSHTIYPESYSGTNLLENDGNPFEITPAWLTSHIKKGNTIVIDRIAKTHSSNQIVDNMVAQEQYLNKMMKDALEQVAQRERSNPSQKVAAGGPDVLDTGYAVEGSGSLGKATAYAHQITDLLSPIPGLDEKALHALYDAIAKGEDESALQMTSALIKQHEDSQQYDPTTPNLQNIVIKNFVPTIASTITNQDTQYEGMNKSQSTFNQDVLKHFVNPHKLRIKDPQTLPTKDAILETGSKRARMRGDITLEDRNKVAKHKHTLFVGNNDWIDKGVKTVTNFDYAKAGSKALTVAGNAAKSVVYKGSRPSKTAFGREVQRLALDPVDYLGNKMDYVADKLVTVYNGKKEPTKTKLGKPQFAYGSPEWKEMQKRWNNRFDISKVLKIKPFNHPELRRR